MRDVTRIINNNINSCQNDDLFITYAWMVSHHIIPVLLSSAKYKSTNLEK